MFHKILIIGLVVSCLAVSEPDAAGVEIALGGWQQALSGTLGYKALSSGDILDLERDLNFDDETRVTGRIKIDMPAFLPNIYLTGAPAEFEGVGGKTISFTFGDTSFNANAVLTSKLTVNQYDVALYYGLPFVKQASAGVFNIDLGINVRILDLEATVTGESGAATVTERNSITLPVPMAYVAFQIVPMDRLSFEAEGRGISIGGNKLYSLTGRVRYQFAGPVFIAGGYRFDKLDVDEDDVVADVDIQGPFIEAGLKF